MTLSSARPLQQAAAAGAPSPPPEDPAGPPLPASPGPRWAFRSILALLPARFQKGMSYVSRARQDAAYFRPKARGGPALPPPGPRRRRIKSLITPLPPPKKNDVGVSPRRFPGPQALSHYQTRVDNHQTTLHYLKRGAARRAASLAGRPRREKHETKNDAAPQGGNNGAPLALRTFSHAWAITRAKKKWARGAGRGVGTVLGARKDWEIPPPLCPWCRDRETSLT